MGTSPDPSTLQQPRVPRQPVVGAGPGKESREEGGRAKGQEAERVFGLLHSGTARFKKGRGSFRRKQVPCQ